MTNNNVYLPLRILNFATFLQYQRFIMPISFLFYLHNGLTFSDFILFQSVYNITCLAAKIPMGFLGDIFSKKHILIFSYFLFMLRVILWINFSGFWIILAGEILYGLFKALFRGNVDSYIYNWLKSKNADTGILSRYGKLSFWTSLGSALSCLLGAFLYKYFGFKILLYIELVLQIIAISFLFFIPDIKKENNDNVQEQRKASFAEMLKSSVIFKPAVSYAVYYSAVLTGLTSVFVWNFQPLLKMSNAPVILFGIVSFVNQVLRGIGGISAKIFTEKFKEKYLIKIEYFAVIISFLAIISAYHLKNYIPVTFCILAVCVAIGLFVVFNVYTVSKIHKNTFDFNRATTSSTNTFLGDLSAFLFLLGFKFLYDTLEISATLICLLILFGILLFPNVKRIHKIFQSFSK